MKNLLVCVECGKLCGVEDEKGNKHYFNRDEKKFSEKFNRIVPALCSKCLERYLRRQLNGKL